MSAPAVVTEKEARLREREAFVAGVEALHVQTEVPSGPIVGRAVERVIRQVDTYYPLPKVQRPRVVTDAQNPDYEWQVNAEGVLWFRWKRDGAPWLRAGSNTENLLLVPTHERVAMWADLFANPTEAVDE